MIRLPAGYWHKKGDSEDFRNTQVMSIYGRIRPVEDSKYGKRYWWEARVVLGAREKTDTPIRGYAKTKDSAKHIVETLLWYTDTVEFP